jgi:hypothetical protein
LARHPEFLPPRVAPSTEVVMGDGLDQTSLPPAMAGLHTAYYLVHSMGSSGKFEEQDRQSAVAVESCLSIEERRWHGPSRWFEKEDQGPDASSVRARNPL